MPSRLLILGLMTTAAAALAGAALADPPGRVGRIAALEGDVSFQPPQQDVWTDASVNFPVTAGEAFWTGDDGRAELEIGGVEARLDNQTEVDVAALSYGAMRLALPQGSLSVQVRGAPRGGVTVSTPAGDVQLPGAGFYRVDVGAPQEDGSYPPVEVTVFAGEAEAPGPQGYTAVEARQAAVLYAGADPELQDAQDTAIDDWSRGRARLEQRTRAAAELPEAMTGAGDLGRYGEFAASPDYGTMWFPRDLPPDWAPYRDGRWAYVAPWGYTWIDDQPWGFAPFHYGRWARIDGRWGWIPGEAAPEPVYAPALVAFIGGPGWSLDVNLGAGEALGWVPLAPDEVYRPPYEVSDAYIRRVNVTNVKTTTIDTVIVNKTVNAVTVNTYRNAPAVTVVRSDAVSRGASVRKAVVLVSAEAIARAPAARPAVAAPMLVSAPWAAISRTRDKRPDLVQRPHFTSSVRVCRR
ncbi:MAG: FecR domain-containing protein, partial [Pseudomonadota bacterium]|nr:FecR domain-containing protein [Pseudomonadota bacterium]